MGAQVPGRLPFFPLHAASLTGMTARSLSAGTAAGVAGVNGAAEAADGSGAAAVLLAMLCSIYNKVFLLLTSLSRFRLMPVYAAAVKLGIPFPCVVWYNA